MNWINNLTTKERWYLGGGSIFLILFLMIQFVYLPLLEATETRQRGIATQDKVLRELLILCNDYEKLKRQREEFQRRLAQRPPGFSIFAYVERQATEAGVKGNIRALNVQRPIPGGAYEEIPLDIRLEKVTLQQLRQFLSQIESAEAFLRVKKLTLNKMKENPGYLAVWMQVASYQARAGSPRAR